jgi:hypothetical protein
MKNIILILCLSFVALSCSKDENNHEPKPNFPEKLIGKWKMTACVERDDIDSTYPCSVQVTKNIYDIWFKKNDLYLSKTHYLCEGCRYDVEELEYHKGYFEITFNPDVECLGTCKNTAVILNLNDVELIIEYPAQDFGFKVATITYTRVE